MTVKILLAGLLVVLAAGGVVAQAPMGPLRSGEEAQERVEPLLEALGTRSLLGVVREEGVISGAKLGRELFAGTDVERWVHAVSRIYDVEHMLEVMLDSLAADTDPADIAPLLDFFEGPLGRRIVALEVAARRARLDPDVQVATGEYLAMLQVDDPERFALLEEFASRNDLIDTNLAATFNARLAFLDGLSGAISDGPGDYGAMPDDIVGGGGAARAEVAQWVMIYLALAFQPLSTRELETYIAFTETAAGRRLNANLFVAYNDLFQRASKQVGRTIAYFLYSEKL